MWKILGLAGIVGAAAVGATAGTRAVQRRQREVREIREADPDELRSVFGSPGYASVQARLTTRLDSMRVHFGVPAEDPVPYQR